MHPGAVKNTFLRHIVFWIFFLPLMTIVIFPLLKLKTNIHPDEIEMVAAAGVDIAAVTAKVNSRFAAMFIKNGIMPASEAFFGGNHKTQRGEGMGLAATAAEQAASWIRGVWLIIYRAMWRMHAMSGLYIAAILSVCLPALVDGLSIRARKRYQFQNHNPVHFYFSFHTAVFVVGLMLFLPLVPVALTPVIVAGAMLSLGLAIWWAAANLQAG